MALMTIRPRGDTKSNWENFNPILKQREIAFEWENTIGVGKPKLKIGDGVTAWNDLDYSIDAISYWNELSEENKKTLITNGEFDSIKLNTSKGSLEFDGEKVIFKKNNTEGNTDCIIEGVSTPTEDNQATNKKYVDDKTQTASDTIQGTVKASDQVIVNENGALEIGRLLDTYGIVNSSKTQQFVQDLIDNISNKVINDLISKNMISNVQVNSNSNIPSSSLVYGMNNQISELNAKWNVATMREISDANEATENLCLYLLSGRTNAPDEDVYYIIQPIVASDQTILQEAIPINTDTSYFRRKMINSVWGQWYKFDHV